MAVRYEVLAVLGVLVLVLAQTYIIVSTTENIAGLAFHGRATQASSSLCINWPATINLSDCDTEFNQSTSVLNYSLECNVTGSHPLNHSLLFFADIPAFGVNLTMNESGELTIRANQSAIGDHTTNIYVEDVFHCPVVTHEVFAFEVLDINDPPFLVSNIPSFSIQVNVEVSAFNLDEYFSDPDDDPLIYGVVGASNFDVIIAGDSSVSFFVSDDFCDEEHVYFTATDNSTLPPQNYTADSNMVTLNAVCPEEPPDSADALSPTPSIPDRCDPEWKCERWSRCYPNGTQSRRCIDLHGCDPNNLEKIFWQECEYIPDPPPEEEEEEEVEEEEEEVVEEVPERERPVLVGEEEAGFVGLIVGSLLGIAVLFFVYVLFRKEILGLYARISWWLTRKARKEILLSDKAKKDLLGLISGAEHSLSLDKSSEFKSSDKIIHGILGAQRLYFKYALGLDLEFTIGDLEKVSAKKVVHDSLRGVLSLFFRKLSYLERNKVFLSRVQVSLLLEELRQLVLNTSGYSKDDYGFVVKEHPVFGSPVNRCVALLYNSMVALQFQEVGAAKDKYMSLLKFYEELPEEEKSLVYDDISRLYHNIKYVLSWN